MKHKKKKKKERKRRKETDLALLWQKRIKYVRRKQSTAIYSDLFSHITSWKLEDIKLMVYHYAVSIFFATYLQIAPIRTYVLLSQLLMVQEMKLPCNHTKFCAFVSMFVPVIFSLPSGRMDVFKRLSSGCLKMVTWSYHRTRRRHNIWKKTSD